MNVQEMIKALLDVGFSEEAIAFGAKVHKSSISRIFTGKTKSPRYHVFNSIELIFDQYVNKKQVENKYESNN